MPLKPTRSSSRATKSSNKEESKIPAKSNGKQEEESKTTNPEATKKEYPNLTPLFKPKVFTTESTSPLYLVTRYVEVTIKELHSKIKKEEDEKHRKPGDEETCPICMCELYENIETRPEAEINDIHDKQMK